MPFSNMPQGGNYTLPDEVDCGITDLQDEVLGWLEANTFFPSVINDQIVELTRFYEKHADNDLDEWHYHMALSEALHSMAVSVDKYTATHYGRKKAMTNTPDAIKSHAADYKDLAWTQYTIEELGSWVHLLVKRAGHRANAEKRAKDLTDARNYLSMIEAHVADAEKAAASEQAA